MKFERDGKVNFMSSGVLKILSLKTVMEKSVEMLLQSSSSIYKSFFKMIIVFVIFRFAYFFC
jgi:hypothetical protein